MSSILLHESLSTLTVQRAKRFIVSIGREALAGYIQREVSERGWSYGEIVRRSGGHIKSASTLVNLVNGNVNEVSERTMRGVAKAFGVEPSFVFGMYYGTHGQNGPEAGDMRHAALAELAPRLTPENLAKYEALMDYVVHTVRQMVKEQPNEVPHRKGKGAKGRVE